MSREGQPAQTPERPCAQGRCAGPVVTRASMRLAGRPSRCFPSRHRDLHAARPPVSGGRTAADGGDRVDPLAMPPPLFTPIPASSDGAVAPFRPSPHRPRATLVPLGDDPAGHSTTTGRDTDAERWFLGATGADAHRPTLRPGADPDHALCDGHPQSPRGGRHGGHRLSAPDIAACGVFLTQVRAGPGVRRCALCLELDAHTSSSGPAPGDRYDGRSRMT